MQGTKEKETWVCPEQLRKASQRRQPVIQGMKNEWSGEGLILTERLVKDEIGWGSRCQGITSPSDLIYQPWVLGRNRRIITVEKCIPFAYRRKGGELGLGRPCRGQYSRRP